MSALSKYKGAFYLILLLAVLPLVVWSMALRDTAVKYRDYRKDRGILEQLQSRPVPAAKEAAGGATGDGEELVASGKFIEAISRTADRNNVAIERYTPYLTYEGNGIEIMTANLEVTGDFSAIVRLLEFIERDISQCRVISLDFKSSKERRSGNIKLTAGILVQQIKFEKQK